MFVQFGCGLLFGIPITFLKGLYELLTFPVDPLKAMVIALLLPGADLAANRFPISINNIVCHDLISWEPIEKGNYSVQSFPGFCLISYRKGFEFETI
jgi:hypothetical protein